MPRSRLRGPTARSRRMRARGYRSRAGMRSTPSLRVTGRSARRLEAVEAAVETVDALDERVEPFGYHGKTIQMLLDRP